VTSRASFGWAAFAVVAVLCAVVFWPKAERGRPKREQTPSAEGGPSSRREAPPVAPSQPEPEVARVVSPAPSIMPSSSPTPADVGDEVPELTEVEKAQVARLPVIYAIRGDYPNDQARFEAMRDALRKSGSSSETWTGSARSIFERWGSSLQGVERTVDGSSLRCYVAGCEVLVTFPDRAAFEQGSARFRGLSEQLPMGRVQTPGVTLSDGRVQVAWMLLRPDTAPPDAG
jgi:hypothetical protein